MRLKLALSVIGVSGLLWSATPAHAAVNLFVPFSGDNFVPSAPPDNPAIPDIVYANGGIKNRSPFPKMVEAPLGHATGGSNGFYVWGHLQVGQGTVVCEVHPIRQEDGFHMGVWTGQSNGSLSAEFRYGLFVQAAPQSGNYFYTLLCTLPPGADIVGVRPDA